MTKFWRVLLLAVFVLSMMPAGMAGAASVEPWLYEGNPELCPGGVKVEFEPWGLEKDGPIDYELTYPDEGAFDPATGEGTFYMSWTDADGNNIEVTVTVYYTDMGQEFDWSSNFPIARVVAKGGPNANVYDYDPASMGDTGLHCPENPNTGKWYEISHIDFCPGDGNGEYEGVITGAKWYDRNKDGEWDEDEPFLVGWKIYLTDGLNTWCALTNAEGKVTFSGLDPGTYYMSEAVAPESSGWVQTYPEGNEHVINLGPNEQKGPYEFGNVCEATAEGGYTLGWWSNKNGAKALGDDWQEFLEEYNQVDKYGDDVDFATYAAFRTWLLKADATNMSYMLSVQMTVTALNIAYMDTDYDGFGVIGWDGEWISIDDLLIEANQFVADNPDTTEAGELRDQAEFYKNIFDGLNNNKQKIIPFEPCDVPSWTCP